MTGEVGCLSRGGAVIRHQGKARGPAPHGPPWAGFPHGGRAALPPWAPHRAPSRPRCAFLVSSSSRARCSSRGHPLSVSPCPAPAPGVAPRGRTRPVPHPAGPGGPCPPRGRWQRFCGPGRGSRSPSSRGGGAGALGRVFPLWAGHSLALPGPSGQGAAGGGHRAALLLHLAIRNSCNLI